MTRLQVPFNCPALHSMFDCIATCSFNHAQNFESSLPELSIDNCGHSCCLLKEVCHMSATCTGMTSMGPSPNTAAFCSTSLNSDTEPATTKCTMILAADNCLRPTPPRQFRRRLTRRVSVSCQPGHDHSTNAQLFGSIPQTQEQSKHAFPQHTVMLHAGHCLLSC